MGNNSTAEPPQLPGICLCSTVAMIVPFPLLSSKPFLECFESNKILAQILSPVHFYKCFLNYCSTIYLTASLSVLLNPYYLELTS